MTKRWDLYHDPWTGKGEAMQINIVSDGLFGKRAFENIGLQFPCRG